MKEKAGEQASSRRFLGLLFVAPSSEPQHDSWTMCLKDYHCQSLRFYNAQQGFLSSWVGAGVVQVRSLLSTQFRMKLTEVRV